MFTLVIGAAASGKSEYAEHLLAMDKNPCKIYIATMELGDEECRNRAKKHQTMRAGKGFTTIECPRNLAAVTIPPGAAVLLECLSNLTANEYFGPQGFTDAAERILADVLSLAECTEHLVVVSNEVFCDGIFYGQETQGYLQCLSRLNNCLAAHAQQVAEVVCGIPIYWKGELLCDYCNPA